MSNRRVFLAALGAATLAGVAPATLAQPADWPTRPVRVVVAFPPGAPGDVAIRLIADRLAAAWKQPVVVENRPGAGGNLGMEAVARAAPDGHTLLVGPNTMFTVNPHVYHKLTFRPETDLVPVTYLAAFTQMLVCNPSVPARSLPDLVKLARAQRMNYASGGPGVPGHLAFEMLQSAASFDMTHVPYRGPSPAMQDVLGGQVPCGFLATPVVLPMVKSGRLVALAVSSATRSPLASEVPTVAEAGVPGFDASFAETLSAPRGTSQAIVDRIQAEVARALATPEVRERLVAADLEPLALSPVEAARRNAESFAKWGEVTRRIKLQLD